MMRHSSFCLLASSILCAGWCGSTIRPLAASSDPLDVEFGDEGRTILFPVGAECQALAMQDDGKLILVGSAPFEGTDRVALARLMPGGEPDPSFGEFGTVSTGFGTGDSGALAVAIQTDGRVVVGGFATGGENGTDILVARFDGSGIQDPDFGDSGRIVIDLQGGEDTARALAIQPDGMILIAGSTAAPESSRDWFVARFDPLGNPDPDFGVGGFSSIDLGGGDDAPAAMELLPDGRIVVVGSSSTAGENDIVVARFTMSGVLDPGFGADGMVTIAGDVGEGGGAECLAIQNDGKIVVGGSLGDADGPLELLLLRLEADGTHDATFGASGMITHDVGPAADVAHDVIVLDDGSLFVSGGSRTSLEPDGGWSIFVARTRPDGALDDRFGTGGLAVTPANGSEVASDAVLHEDSTVVVSGTALAGADGGFLARRYRVATSPSMKVFAGMDPDVEEVTDGQSLPVDLGITPLGVPLARPFALHNAGTEVLEVTGAELTGAFEIAAASGFPWVIPPGGGFDFEVVFLANTVRGGHVGEVRLTGGDTGDGSFDFTVGAEALFEGNPTAPDLTFGNDGATVVDFAGGNDDAEGMAIQADGRIIQVGIAHDGAYFQFAVVRYRQDGSLDPEFGERNDQKLWTRVAGGS